MTGGFALPSFFLMKYNHAIKRHLKASNPKQLEIAMLRNNILKGMFFKYEDIQQGSDGQWYAWYLEEPKNNPIEAAKELNGANQK